MSVFSGAISVPLRIRDLLAAPIVRSWANASLFFVSTQGEQLGSALQQLALQQSELVRLRKRTSFRSRRLAALVVAVMLPLAALASDRFPDVPNSNVHHDNINAIAAAGITAGCAGSNYCPGDLVRRDQMGSFLARLGGLGTNLPVANARSESQTYCSLAKRRPESFPEGPCQGALRTAVDTVGGVGFYTSIAVGTDGNPVISYNDATVNDLKVAKCANPTCVGAATLTTVDSAGVVGHRTSIAIGTDGNPVISYRDATNGDLKVAKCTSPACTGAAAITAVDAAGNNGDYTSIVIGTDGNPVISYQDIDNADLKVAKCANPACTGAATLTAVDTAGAVGEHTSIAIGGDGNPVISYRDATNADLKIAKCITPACTGATTLTAVDTTGNQGAWTSIAIGIDRNPVISYEDVNNSQLRIAKCATPSCTGAVTITVVDTVGGGGGGGYTSIAIGTEGSPVISYLGPSLNLKVAKCTTPACTGALTTTAVDNGPAWVGWYTSIAIGVDGHPVISYWDFDNDDLKVARPPLNL